MTGSKRRSCHFCSFIIIPCESEHAWHFLIYEYSFIIAANAGMESRMVFSDTQ